ncbi:hypothetical protein BHM03_00004114 [Ensete ventricosum]|nr:hypothetical protein BHM03_00004114 [Ensete ventricosum]
MEVDSTISTESGQDPAAGNRTEHPNGPSSSPSAPEAVPPAEPQPVAPGPRPAPGYSVVNAVIERKEDGPGCRCGHTLTAVAAVGEEGTPGYIGPRLILFGGATALEGNSAAPASPTGSAGIRINNKFFETSILFMVFGCEYPFKKLCGIYLASMSGPGICFQGDTSWRAPITQGRTCRNCCGYYGGSSVLMSGKRPLADVWALDTAAKPYEWRKLEPEGEGPPPCM